MLAKGYLGFLIPPKVRELIGSDQGRPGGTENGLKYILKLVYTW